MAEAGETNIVLRFTEVDDGTGAPSDYEVRYAEGTSFVWDEGLDVTKGSCASPMQGDNIAATRNCTVDGLNDDTDYAFQLVAYRTDNGEKVYGPLSNQPTGRTEKAPLIVDVTPSSFQVGVNATKQLTAKVTDKYGNPVEEPVTWNSNKSSVASVDNNGLSKGQSPGNAAIKASTASGEFDTSDGTVTDDDGGGGGGGGGGGQNEPPGMTQVTERFFNQDAEDGWSSNSKHNYVTDSTATVDAPTVLEMSFGPCSSCGGSSLGNQIWKLFSTRGEELYIRYVFKYSDNWEGNPGANKIMYTSSPVSPGTPGYLLANGGGQGALALQYNLQGQDYRVCGGDGVSRNLYPNRGDATIQRGRWYEVELRAKANTYDPNGQETCDGELEMWLDGQLILSYSDVHFFNRSGSSYGGEHTKSQWTFSEINFNPVYGGGEVPIPSRQGLYSASIRASVR